MINLSSTVNVSGKYFYLVDDIIQVVYAMNYTWYINNILKMFSKSGVGIIPFIDEVCGYRPWMTKDAKKYIEIFSEELNK